MDGSPLATFGYFDGTPAPEGHYAGGALGVFS